MNEDLCERNISLAFSMAGSSRESCKENQIERQTTGVGFTTSLSLPSSWPFSQYSIYSANTCWTLPLSETGFVGTHILGMQRERMQVLQPDTLLDTFHILRYCCKFLKFSKPWFPSLWRRSGEICLITSIVASHKGNHAKHSTVLGSKHPTSVSWQS